MPPSQGRGLSSHPQASPGGLGPTGAREGVTGHGLAAPAKCLWHTWQGLLGLGLLIRKMGNEFPSATGCLGHTQLQALPVLGEASLETPSL